MDRCAFPLKHLEPRECFLSRTPTLVSTVLGSCVAITVFDPRTKIGGMAHAFLPRAANYPEDPGFPCKFVDTSMQYMLRVLKRLGVQPDRLELKIFGGGDSWTQGYGSNKTGSWAGVGPRNVEAARAVAAELGMCILAEDVGGAAGRKVMFLTHTGGVWVKKLGNSGAG